MRKYKVQRPMVKQRSHDNEKRQKESPKQRKLEDHICTCGFDDLFPWWCPYVVTIVTMVVRVSYVVSSRSWWILHPDEVYQSIEVAFSEIYGYGFRSYEYLPAPTNISVSMETQILKSGMFGLRSFVLPYMFAAAIMIAKLVGITSSPYLICRVFNAMVCSSLPLAVYGLTNTIFHCDLLSLLSCVMAASSLHLVVLGTHPLVNSFTAPFVILGLSLCLKKQSHISTSINSSDKKPKDSCSDVNENVLVVSENGHKSSQIDKDVTSKYRTSEKRMILETAPSVMNNHHSKQKSTVTDKGLSSVGQTSTILDFCWKACVGGAIIGFATYVRPDVSLFVAMVYLSLTLATKNTWPGSSFAIICGATSSVSIGMADDLLRYGYFVCSPVQWFKFNVMSSKAGKLFNTGTSNIFTDIFLMDKVNFIIFFLVLTTLIIFSLFKTLRIASSRSLCALVVSYITLVTVYSIIGHTEPRIIHNIFILQAVISAGAIHDLMPYFEILGAKRSQIRQSILIMFIISAIHTYKNFPSAESHTASNWSYKDPEQSRDVNLCLNFLRDQSDVKGVLVNASVYNIGGYSVLEHDVPILVQVHHEYHLYEVKNHNRLGENNSIRVFTDFSDFIDIENQLYVRKLCNDKSLNYIVTASKNGLEFRTMGYENVFVFGKYSVFRKIVDRKLEINHLREETIEDVSILEYEANWLITNALYSKAIRRLNTAFRINRKLHLRPRVRLFQLSLVCYSKLDEWDKVKSIKNECFAVYGRERCLKQEDKIVRHEEYQHFN